MKTAESQSKPREIPQRRKEKKPNQQLAKERIIVEHVNRKLKIFGNNRLVPRLKVRFQY
jgi:hypothetical protein